MFLEYYLLLSNFYCIISRLVAYQFAYSKIKRGVSQTTQIKYKNISSETFVQSQGIIPTRTRNGNVPWSVISWSSALFRRQRPIYPE